MKKLFFSLVIICSFFPELSPQIKFLPFTINGSQIIAQLLYTGNKTFYASANSYLLKTTNYFKTWDTLYHYTNGNFSFAVDTINEPSNRIIVFTSDDTLKPHFITLDGGKTWSSINTKKENYVFSNNKIYGNNYYSLWQSTDNGNTWNGASGPGLGYNERYSWLRSDINNNLYVSVSGYAYSGMSQYAWGNLQKSTDGGLTWVTKAQAVGAPGQEFFWRIVNCFDYIAITGNFGMTYSYDIRNDILRTINQDGDFVSMDKLETIYLLRSELPPEYRTLRSSTDWGVTWRTDKIDYPFGGFIKDLFFDEYGYLYSGAGTDIYYVKTQDPLYTYLSSESIKFDSTTINDLTYKKITVYNPIGRALSLDSVVVNNPSFLVKNFIPVNIPAHSSVDIEFGFVPASAESLKTAAIIYLEDLSFQVNLSGKGFITNVDDFSNNYNYDLFQNYPNPFNPSTKIRFSIPERLNVKLEILNILGQKIVTLLDTKLEKGIYEKEFNAERYRSGVYIYRLEAGGYISSKKLLLLK